LGIIAASAEQVQGYNFQLQEIRCPECSNLVCKVNIRMGSIHYFCHQCQTRHEWHSRADHGARRLSLV